MAKQPLEKLLPKAGMSIYKLVRMASDRAVELAEGKPKLVNAHGSEKETTVALEEIIQGKVVARHAIDEGFCSPDGDVQEAKAENGS
ncbi:MAG: DNA-directed RNA polymerase subunit omega [Candidatus Omnitrophica bacterium]|nr:DNA-directed RNA polymerase subunit omega [Candidatus Omnitrophota bacterium]